MTRTVPHNPYSSAAEHLNAVMQHLGLAVATACRERQKTSLQENWLAAGLYMSDGEVLSLANQIVDRPFGTREHRLHGPEASELDALATAIEKQVKASRDAHVQLPLVELQDRFRLNSLDLDIFLLCLAPHVDPRFQRVYGYLHDDMTRPWPSPSLVMDILSIRGLSFDACLERMQSDSPLIAGRLIRIIEDDGPLLSRRIRLDDRVVSFILGIPQVDSALAGFASFAAEDSGSTRHLEATKVDLLARTLLQECGHAALVLECEDSRILRDTVQSACAAIGTDALYVDCRRLARVRDEPELLALIYREARLTERVIVWEEAEALADGSSGCDLESVIKRISTQNDVPSIFTASRAATLLPYLDGITPVLVQIPRPTDRETEALWHRELQLRGLSAGAAEISQVAATYRLCASQIAAAAAFVKGKALQNDATNVFLSDLQLASRAQSNSRLESLATRITPRYTWSDIVLPEDQGNDLHELSTRLRNAYRVYDDWGFGARARGRGTTILFSGPSGTGKTMAAEVLAGEIGLDLYKIDLSIVVSKYIGETEKNLDRIFLEAETSNAILFFDEADALFGKRSEVRDSHDRYANIEIAYLLQKMETYDGVVILATNFRRNLDDAFERRMDVSIDFSMPDEAQRESIWRLSFPAKAPLSSEVDFATLARQFRLAGGNIKNIALGAAYLAAADGQVITADHIRTASRRELRKMGRLIDPTLFDEGTQSDIQAAEVTSA